MESKTKILVVLGVIVSLGLVACAVSPAAPSITVEDLTGLWYDADRDEYLQLNEDGTYRVATTVGFIKADPYELGRFRLEGTSFTFVTSDESPDCQGQTGSYQVELTEGASSNLNSRKTRARSALANNQGPGTGLNPEFRLSVK